MPLGDWFGLSASLSLCLSVHQLVHSTFDFVPYRGCCQKTMGVDFKLSLPLRPDKPMSVCLSIHLSVRLPIHLSVCPSICLSIRFFQALQNLTKRQFLALFVQKLPPYKGNPHGGGFVLKEGTKLELQRFSIFCQSLINNMLCFQMRPRISI